MKNIDLIIFGGQSNMQGQTEGLPEDNFPIEGAYEYLFAENCLVALKHPVGENLDLNGKPFTPDFNDIPGALGQSVLLASWENHANMVPSFCRAYLSATARNVVAVHAAKGSTSIDYWLKGSVGYDFLVKKSLAAIKLVKPEHILFVWLQGESDALIGMSEKEYREKIISLNHALKEDVGIEKFGVISVGIFAGDIRDQCISDAQKKYAKSRMNFYFLLRSRKSCFIFRNI